MLIQTGDYDSFKTVVRDLRADFAVFVFDNTIGAGGHFSVWGFPKFDGFCVRLIDLAARPTSFSTDFPDAITLNTALTINGFTL